MWGGMNVNMCVSECECICVRVYVCMSVFLCTCVHMHVCPTSQLVGALKAWGLAASRGSIRGVLPSPSNTGRKVPPALGKAWKLGPPEDVEEAAARAACVVHSVSREQGGGR